MPLAYPLAETPRDALGAQDTARTLGEARDKAGAAVSLVMEWLRPSASEREAMQDAISSGVAQGFVQLYEDAQGNPVLAVSFWRRGPAPAPVRPVQPAAPAPEAGDTVNDLYFETHRSSRRRLRGRRPADPNQLDLFAAPDAAGDDTPDPGALNVMPDAEAGGEGQGARAAAPRKKPRSPRGKSRT